MGIRQLSIQPAIFASDVFHFSVMAGRRLGISQRPCGDFWSGLFLFSNRIKSSTYDQSTIMQVLPFSKGLLHFNALSNAFKSMPKDPDLCPMYFIINALDEYEQRLPDLAKLMSTAHTLSGRMKRLVLSRPECELKSPSFA
jgi:hypothetical protein